MEHDKTQLQLTRRKVVLGGAATMALAVGGALAGDLVAFASPKTASGGRSRRSFDEEWRFHLGNLSGAEAPQFDDSSWRKVDLPHDWSIEDLPDSSDDGGATTDPALLAFLTDPTLQSRAPARIGPFDGSQGLAGKSTAYTTGGEGWYRKHFLLPDLRPGDRVEIGFEGVYCNSDVWLNGQHLGERPYGYIGFQYDLTPFLIPGAENVLAVRVRNLGATSRWYSGSGIYRHTWLTVTSPVHVPTWGVAITTPVVGSQTSSVQTVVEVLNASPGESTSKVRCSLLDAAGKTIVSNISDSMALGPGASGSRSFLQSMPNAKLWSPSSPSLYRALIEVLVDGKVVDSVEETFGVRSVVMNDKGFLLNGVQTKMLGSNIHHDHGPLGAVSLDRSEERRVQILKDAGFNAIRTAHNPAPPSFLKACDRLGMLVYHEIFDMWHSSKTSDDYSQHFDTWSQLDVTDFVRSDRNHPSVVIRSIGNEVDNLKGPDLFHEFASRGAALAATVRRIDPTRPVCQGGGDGMMELTDATRASSYCDAYTDVGDLHYHHSYHDKPAANPGKAWIQSESFPASTFTDYRLMMSNDYAIGDFVWTGWDYLGESGIGTPLLGAAGSKELLEPADPQSTIATTAAAVYPVHLGGGSDLDMLGQPRPQLLYRRVVWGLSPLEVLVERPTPPGLEQQSHGWGWRDELESWTWEVNPLQLMRIHVYTQSDLVKLFLNGLEVGSVTLTDANRYAADFQIPYTPGELTAVAFTKGRETARKTLATTGQPAALRLTSDTANLTTGRNDLAHVLVEVVDVMGRRVPDAVVKVNFGVSGGTLAGVANGNRNNVDSFQRPRRWTYLGRAMAIVRPPKNTGIINVVATAAGLRSATLTLPVASA